MTTPKIVQFEKKLSAEQQEIQDEIVRILKDELARAKRGDYVAIAVAAVGTNGAACTVSSKTVHGPALMGSVYHLLTRVHGDLSSEPVYPPSPDHTEDET